MTLHRLPFLIFGFVLALANASIGQSATTNPVQRLTATYEAEREKLELAARQKSVALGAQVVKSVEALERNAQAAGNLELLLACRQESARLGGTTPVATNAPAVTAPELLRLRQDYRAAAEKLELEQARDVLALAGRFEQSLQRLQARLTQEGKVEEALTVKATAKAVGDRPEVTAARFTVAAAEGRARAAKPAVVAPAAPSAPAVAATPRPGAEADEEVRLRKRYYGFCDALAACDIPAATGFLDPRFVQRAGTEVVRPYLSPMTNVVKLMKAAGITLDAGAVRLDLAAGEARNVPRVWYENAWHDKDPMYWVRVEGDWYLDCRDRKKPAVKAP